MINTMVNTTEYEYDEEIKLSDIINNIFMEELHQFTTIILYLKGEEAEDEIKYNQVHKWLVEQIMEKYHYMNSNDFLGYEFLVDNKEVYLNEIENYIISESGISQGLSFFELAILNHDWERAFIYGMGENDLKYYPDIYPRREE